MRMGRGSCLQADSDCRQHTAHDLVASSWDSALEPVPFPQRIGNLLGRAFRLALSGRLRLSLGLCPWLRLRRPGIFRRNFSLLVPLARLLILLFVLVLVRQDLLVLVKVLLGRPVVL